MTTVEFPVTPAHILMFARAIGEEPALPLAEDIAPSLTFVQAASHFDPGYPLRPRAGEPWRGSGRSYSGVGSAGVEPSLHAEQQFEYHRPVRAGQRLRAESHPGETWEKAGRSGALRFVETITEFRDDAGELVVTARSVSVKTGPPR